MFCKPVYNHSWFPTPQIYSWKEREERKKKKKNLREAERRNQESKEATRNENGRNGNERKKPLEADMLYSTIPKLGLYGSYGR